MGSLARAPDLRGAVGLGPWGPESNRSRCGPPATLLPSSVGGPCHSLWRRIGSNRSYSLRPASRKRGRVWLPPHATVGDRVLGSGANGCRDPHHPEFPATPVCRITGPSYPPAAAPTETGAPGRT